MRTRSFFAKILTSPKWEALFPAFTPPAAEHRSPLVRTAVAVGTISVFGVALATATSALTLLLVAVGIVFFMLTQILGVQLELDPQVLFRQAMQTERPSSAPN